jgi:hypothetical protein
MTSAETYHHDLITKIVREINAVAELKDPHFLQIWYVRFGRSYVAGKTVTLTFIKRASAMSKGIMDAIIVC